VPAAQQALLAPCGGGTGFCAPDDLIRTGNNSVPPSCTSIAGAEGRCMSTCLPDIAAQAALLPQSSCDAGFVCAPCDNPVAADPTAPTGACALGCDHPAQPPLLLTCPWTGPAVIDPSTLPACSPACGGAHCLPAAYVPAAQQALLAPCDGGAGFCAPDPLISTAANYVPPTCTPFANVTASEGRCLSTCLPSIAAQSTLEQSSCTTGDRCAPCWDPFSGVATGACATASCDQPRKATYTFPLCCGGYSTNPIGTCVPLSQLAASGTDASSLPQDTCASVARCVPDIWLPGNAPLTCTDRMGASGSCVARCVNNSGLLGQGSCPTSAYKCVPCWLAPAGTPGC
jgi:hypothetical protein